MAFVNGHWGGNIVVPGTESKPTADLTVVLQRLTDLETFRTEQITHNTNTDATLSVVDNQIFELVISVNGLSHLPGELDAIKIKNWNQDTTLYDHGDRLVALESHHTVASTPS